MHYVEKGDPSKPLMLFLHGFPEFWYSWRFQLEYFSQNYWCVAPDLRGYNDTDKPTGVDSYHLDQLATDVQHLVKALDRESCILVGHDWGGLIGYRVADLYPEVVKTYIAVNGASLQAFTDAIIGVQALKSWYMLYICVS